MGAGVGASVTHRSQPVVSSPHSWQACCAQMLSQVTSEQKGSWLVIVSLQNGSEQPGELLLIKQSDPQDATGLIVGKGVVGESVGDSVGHLGHGKSKAHN